MAPQLSKRTIIGRQLLEGLVETRLDEAKVLFSRKLYLGTVYLAGYAVECQLKATICKTLGLVELPETFKTHDLELLLLHSGAHAKLSSDIGAAESFKKICGFWNNKMDLRYKPPEFVCEKDANLFLSWIDEPKVGIIPWLRRTI